jgi:hypothetical protein
MEMEYWFEKTGAICYNQKSKGDLLQQCKIKKIEKQDYKWRKLL